MKRMILFLIIFWTVLLFLMNKAFGYSYLSTYKFAGKNYPIYEVTQEQKDIYDKHEIPRRTMIKLATIKMLETPHQERGDVYNSSDCGPFQINKIHRKDYDECVAMIKAGKKKELFEKQMLWTFNRMIAKHKQICYKWGTDYTRARCQFWLHNGNTNKTCNGKARAYCYAWKGLIIRQFYLNNL